MADYSNKPCVGSKLGPCPSGGKKGKNQLTQLRCYRCSIDQKKATKASTHSRHVQGTYGLAEGEYEELYDAQGGKCAMPFCNATGKVRKLAVDHDHKVEALLGMRLSLRGLLCKRCNYTLLGKFGDNPETYDAIAHYLRTMPAQAILNGEDDE